MLFIKGFVSKTLDTVYNLSLISQNIFLKKSIKSFGNDVVEIFLKQEKCHFAIKSEFNYFVNMKSKFSHLSK